MRHDMIPGRHIVEYLAPGPGMLLLFLLISTCPAAEPLKIIVESRTTNSPMPLAAVLPQEKWQQFERSIDKALAWIASQQAADGSFPTPPSGQPAVTSLCVMAFLSRGHQPGMGAYG